VTTLHIIDGVGHGNYFGNDYIENSSKLVNDFIEKVQNR
jgi:hypothetical protein